MVILFYLLTPFSYLEINGLRFILIQVLVGLLAALYFFIRKPKLHSGFAFPALAVLLVVTAGYYLASGNVDSLLAVSVFLLLMFFSFYLAENGPLSIESIKLIYIATCVFAAFGLAFQLVVNKLFGISFFRHQLFGGNRNAYSFIWADYSFISLFVVSCLPLVLRFKSRLLVFLTFLFLLFSSLVSSARTGVAALFLLTVCLVSLKYLTALVRGRMALKYLVLAAAMLVTPVIGMYALPLITGRQLTISSSGRVDDFILGFQFFSSHPFFGALLDKERYGALVSTVPHNFFLYPLFMGGVIYFFCFMVFVLSLVQDLKSADSDLLASLLLCFFGFQFIPSFFSAYFLAILLGIAMASSSMNRYRLRMMRQYSDD